MQVDDAVIEDEAQVVEDATEVEEVAEQQEESGAAEGATESTEAAADDGEIVVSIAGAEPAAEDAEAERAPAWVRDLRKANREKDRRIRELEAKLQTPAQQAQAAVVVGAKPTLESCEWDSDKFADALEQWHERKRQADEQAAKVKQAEQSAQQAWQARLQDYEAKAKTLRVSDFEDAQAAAQDVLSVVQQGVILNGAENPALLVYALGKNPSKARELAGISDPVKFAFAVAKLEKDLKVQPRKVAPAPEKVVRAAGALPTVGAAQVEKLRAEAQKTGDFTRYLEAKRKLKG
jgi:hypothetical protein